jgi:hypothetical protein
MGNVLENLIQSAGRLHNEEYEAHVRELENLRPI